MQSSHYGCLARFRTATTRRTNWNQFAKFCVVGSSGYVVNLAVYTIMLRVAGVNYIASAVGSFIVAVGNNYSWNRIWTFRHARGSIRITGLRFLTVSTVALGVNLALLEILVQLGVDPIVAQATAIILVTPLNFAWNKIWSFRRHQR